MYPFLNYYKDNLIFDFDVNSLDKGTDNTGNYAITRKVNVSVNSEEQSLNFDNISKRSKIEFGNYYFDFKSDFTAITEFKINSFITHAHNYIIDSSHTYIDRGFALFLANNELSVRIKSTNIKICTCELNTYYKLCISISKNNVIKIYLNDFSKPVGSYTFVDNGISTSYPLTIGDIYNWSPNNYVSNINLKFLRMYNIKVPINEAFYLIQDNTDDKIYNYDEENNQLVEVIDTSILHKDTLNNTCIYDLNKVIDLIDLTDENISILSNKNVKLNVEGIKSDKELIISNQNLSTVTASTIHNFVLDVAKTANGNIKFVISDDNGLTWKTWNGTTWDTLTNTCPLTDANKVKQYSELSDSEKNKWNQLKEEIWTNGIATDTADVDYNLLGKSIRFAFVLYRPSYADNVTLKNLSIVFDKIGNWHKLSESDIDIAINTNSCSVTAKQNNLTNVKVNILI